MKILGYTIIKTSKFLHICEKLAIFVVEKLRNKDTFNMKFNVTIQTALPIQSGTSKAGKPWSKQSFVGVYDNSNAQYPKSIVFDVLGDNIGKFGLQPGGQYEIEVDFSSREYQGKFYMSAVCWKSTALQPQPYAQPQQPYQQPPSAQPFYGQAPTYPVNPNSATPTLDSMGVQGYQQPQSQSLPKEEDSDLPF